MIQLNNNDIISCLKKDLLFSERFNKLRRLYLDVSAEEYLLIEIAREYADNYLHGSFNAGIKNNFLLKDGRKVKIINAKVWISRGEQDLCVPYFELNFVCEQYDENGKLHPMSDWIDISDIERSIEIEEATTNEPK